MTLTAAQVKAIAGPGAKAALVAAVVRGWPSAVTKAKLTTKNRAAHFLAQIMTETGGLQILEESGAYRAPQIMKIFGVGEHSAKITQAEANRIAALPVAQRGPVLFNRVYGVGNPKKMREFNNTGPNDGWLYRGGGMMQATGKSNYAAMAKKTGLPLVEHPELLHQPDSAFKAAYLEWIQDGRCNAAADRDDVVTVRKVINGGRNGLEECKVFLAKAKKVLAGYSVDAAAPEPEPVQQPETPEDAPPNVQPVDPAVLGDPVLNDVQQRLKARRYPPGVIDGKWGSGTSGALSGFMTDRGLRLHLPTNLKEFQEIADEVRAELLEAETENWFRPVSEARANADSNIIKELAPEIAPVKRNFFSALGASIVAFLGTLWQTVSGYVSDAWNFFTDHKDVIDDHPGILSTVLGYVAAVPIGFWLFTVGCGLAFITYNSWRAIRTSTQAVQNGERQ
jgi:predicted chitinase/peptidoglycan hydrolase-like protein with peptidoglycan-binding domain